MTYKKNSAGNFSICLSFSTRRGNIRAMFSELTTEGGRRFLRTILACSSEKKIIVSSA